MTSKREVLNAIAEMRNDLSEWKSGIEQRLDVLERNQVREATRSKPDEAWKRHIDQNIEALTKTVSELSKSNALLREWCDRVALDKGAACRAFEDQCGVDRRQALKILDSAGYIRKHNGHRTMAVRVPSGVVRALVIYKKRR